MPGRPNNHSFRRTGLHYLNVCTFVVYLQLCSGAIFLFVAFTPIPAGEIQLFTTFPFLEDINAVVVRRKYNACDSQQLQICIRPESRASLETVPPPRDRLILGGQSEPVSWWFFQDHIHGTSSSIFWLRYNRSALAVTTFLRVFLEQSAKLIFKTVRFLSLKY